MALARYEHQGAAAPTTLASGIDNSALSFMVATGTGSGYPTGIVGGFIMCIDAGTPSEEKMLCSARSSDTFTVTTRGIDGTSATAHSSGAVVTHVFGAIEADDDNSHIYVTTRDDHAQYVDVAGTRIQGDAAWTLVAGGVGFQNSWAQGASGAHAVGFRKLFERVYLRGTVDAGTGGTIAFTLPSGYRPSATGFFACYGSPSNPAAVLVDSGGNVTPENGETVSFDNISFDTL